METDLKKIEAQAESHWADNWNFRAFLQQEVDPVELDRTVQALNREVSSQIDCTACANCCKETHPYLSARDISRLSRGLGTTNADLKKRLLQREPDNSFIFCTKPCPFLSNGLCQVYEHRPDDCREYPHLHKPKFLARSIFAIENYRVCPIVFNVYERLKLAFSSYIPTKDYIGDNDPETTHGSSYGKRKPLP